MIINNNHNLLLLNGDGECSLMAAYRWAYGSSRSAWSRGQQPPGTVLHSSHEPGEHSQCFRHDDSTITIILVLLISKKLKNL